MDLRKRDGQTVVDRSARHRLAQAFAALDPCDRQLLWLASAEELDNAALSAQLGVALEEVEQRLTRVLLGLVRCLDEDDP